MIVPVPDVPYGTVYPSLPYGYAIVYAGGVAYYFHNGTYYQRRHSNYVVIEPPAGTVVRSLPSNTTRIVVEGVNYYYCNGIYYLRNESGYIVVPAPAGVPSRSPAVTSGKVTIISEVLNVRSGPSKRYPVIGKLYRGEVVHVSGSGKGWYYVKFARGQFGWIMSQFTAPVYEKRHRSDG